MPIILGFVRCPVDFYNCPGYVQSIKYFNCEEVICMLLYSIYSNFYIHIHHIRSTQKRREQLKYYYYIELAYKI